MKKVCSLIAVAAFAFPMLASANEPGHLGIYYVPSANLDVEVPGLGSGDDDGDGFGAKVYVPLGQTQSFIVTGEYQSTSYDDSDLELDQFRAGGGIQSPLGLGSLAVYGEYANFDFDEEEADGFGVHGRLSFPIADTARVYGQLGYLMLEADNTDLDGLEFSVGGAFDFAPNIGVFAELRQTNLEGDDDVEYEFQDVRLGVNIYFGAFGG